MAAEGSLCLYIQWYPIAVMNVLVVTHHVTILAVRATLERLSPEEFIKLDEHEKPLNCGVTIYRGIPDKGKDGQLELMDYNVCLYDKK